jgi:hypothetical protein
MMEYTEGDLDQMIKNLDLYEILENINFLNSSGDRPREEMQRIACAVCRILLSCRINEGHDSLFQMFSRAGFGFGFSTGTILKVLVKIESEKQRVIRKNKGKETKA